MCLDGNKVKGGMQIAVMAWHPVQVPTASRRCSSGSCDEYPTLFADQSTGGLQAAYAAGMGLPDCDLPSVGAGTPLKELQPHDLCQATKQSRTALAKRTLALEYKSGVSCNCQPHKSKSAVQEGTPAGQGEAVRQTGRSPR
jgi:hypothetical protein